MRANSNSRSNGRPDPTPLSTMERLRQETHAHHDHAESRSFVSDLLAGRLSLAAYGHYLAQLSLIYRALESRSVQPEDPSVIGDQAVLRGAAIAADLTALGVTDDDPRRRPLAATQSYVDRLDEVATASWVTYLPHHYVRYLGDMSGGQVMATLLRRAYGAQDDQLGFFSFDNIDNLVRYKRTYRQHIDDIDLSRPQVDAMVRECQDAFGFNSALFDELSEQSQLTDATR